MLPPTCLIFLHVQIPCKSCLFTPCLGTTVAYFLSSLQKKILKICTVAHFFNNQVLCDYTYQNPYDQDHLSLCCVIVWFCLPADMLIVPVCYCNLPLNTIQKHFEKLTPSRKDRADLYSAGPYASWRKDNCWEWFSRDLVLSEAYQRRTQMPGSFFFFIFCSQRKRF